jgi:hypothetical protein
MGILLVATITLLLGVAYPQARIETPYSKRVTVAESPKDGRDLPFTTFAFGAQLPTLDSVSLPANVREIRITELPGMLRPAHWPGDPMLRVVDLGNNNAFGELSWYEYIADFYPQIPEGRCVPVADKKVCITTSQTTTKVDWESVVRELDRLGAWLVSQPCHRESFRMNDLESLEMHRLEGSEFSRYSCYAPGFSRTPTGSQLSALQTYFHQLIEQIWPKPTSPPALTSPIRVR